MPPEHKTTSAPQPTRPAHIGDNRIELAQSWVKAMNLNALRYGFYEDARIEIISGSGHNSIESTLAAQSFEPPPMKWSAPIVRKAEEQRWLLRDPSPKRLS